MSQGLTIVLCEAPGPGPAERWTEQGIGQALGRLPGVELVVLPHLYDLAPEGPAVGRLRAIEGDFILLAAVYPRAAYWVLRANGIGGRMGPTAMFPVEELARRKSGMSDPAERTIWCFDLRASVDEAPLVAEIRRIVHEVTGEPIEPPPVEVAPPAVLRTEEATASRWYPVIDYDRCINCLECLNFCLFGTFGIDSAGHIFVEQPDACRDGCPACSRICPKQAIMFPEYTDPAIAGDHAARHRSSEIQPIEFLGMLGSAPSAPPKPKAVPPVPKDDLDRLVDELDASGL